MCNSKSSVGSLDMILVNLCGPNYLWIVLLLLSDCFNARLSWFAVFGSHITTEQQRRVLPKLDVYSLVPLKEQTKWVFADSYWVSAILFWVECLFSNSYYMYRTANILNLIESKIIQRIHKKVPYLLLCHNTQQTTINSTRVI